MRDKKILNPLIKYLRKFKILNLIPDALYLKLRYYRKMKKKLNLKNPKTFNEKLQWLKLNDKKEIYTIMVDKCKVKEYVGNCIGYEYIIPTFGVYEKFDDIPFFELPKQFVIKSTHDSGSVVICKDKATFDRKTAKLKLNNALKNNYFYESREWPYKNVKPRIIIEKYMLDESNYELKDYKIYCFNGNPYIIQLDFDRFINHKRNFYDLNWNLLDLEMNYQSDKLKNISKPVCLKKMIDIATRLSNGIPFVRVDLYVVNNKIYFGELTFYPEGGFTKFVPEFWNDKLGRTLKLSN